METLLFDSYRKFWKENNGNTIRRLSKLPPTEIVFFVLAIVSAVVSVIFNALAFNKIAFGSMCVEIIMCIILFFHTENFRIKTVDTRFVTYKEHCNKVYKWLKDTGISVSPQNIEVIKLRAEKQVEKQSVQKDRNIKNAKYILEVVFAPLLLSIYSVWMTGKTDVNELIQAAISLFFTCGSIGAMIYLFYYLLSFYKKYKLEQLKCFVSDLQGVLDTQFSDKLF